MKLSDAEVRELFQRSTARNDASDCPDRDTLMRAARGALEAVDRNRVADHIARCSDCAREFRIARELTPFETSVRDELAPPRRSAWLPIAAGIVLAISLPAWIGFVLEQRRDNATIQQLLHTPGGRASRPPAPGVPPGAKIEIDAPIVDLDTDITRGSANLPTIKANTFTLILHLPEETSEAIDLEIVNANGAILATERIPGRKNRSSITVAVPRKIAGEGEHAVRIRWRGKSATFRFLVERP